MHSGFDVQNEHQIIAYVPSGAKSGKISVTTPGGTVYSTEEFKVTDSPVIWPDSPEAIAKSEQSLVLNGKGLRRFSKGQGAYRAELYLAARNWRTDKILQSNQIKRLRLSFLEDVSSTTLIEELRDGVRNNCAEMGCGAFGMRQVDYVAHWIKPMPAKWEMDFIFYPTSVKITVMGHQITNAGDGNFAKAVLASWIGSHPISKRLKKELLGIR